MAGPIPELCRRRSQRHHVKWGLLGALMFWGCIPAGFYPFFLGQWTWGPLFGSFIGSMGLYFFLRGVLSFLMPQWGKPGRSIQRYLAGTMDIEAAFRSIDQDMAEHGTQFGRMWVGRDWILGEEAMPISRIRGIFSFKIRKFYMNEYDICLVDDKLNVQVDNIGSEDQLDKIYRHLTKRLPRAARGNFSDYKDFMFKSEEEMTAFNEDYLHPKALPPDYTFTFTEADGIPTSLATSEKIHQAIAALQPGRRVSLSARTPPLADTGYCIEIICYRWDGDDEYALQAHFKNGEKEERIFTRPSIPSREADKVMLDYFEKLKSPDVSTWEDQTHQLYDAPPMEAYILYADGCRYEHITYDDVLASFENLNEGSCKSFLLRTPSWQNGYMEVTGNRGDYSVEIAGFDKDHTICGFRIRTPYEGQVSHWLSEYYHQYKYPQIREGWEDISEEVRQKVAPPKEETL